MARLDPLGLTERGSRPEPEGTISLWVARLLLILCEDVLEYLDLSRDIHGPLVRHSKVVLELKKTLLSSGLLVLSCGGG